MAIGETAGPMQGETDCMSSSKAQRIVPLGRKTRTRADATRAQVCEKSIVRAVSKDGMSDRG